MEKHAIVAQTIIMKMGKQEKEEENMVYFTSDLHLGHAAVIGLSHRPFSDVEEMNETLIKNWNKTVMPDDDVYILGDLIFRAEQPPEYFLKRLRGKKHLIFGNHDEFWIDKVNLADYFVDWGNYAVVNTGNGKATVCHFPMLHGDGKYLIHGHLHNRTTEWYWEFYKTFDRALNAGVDINDFRPVTIAQLIENNKRFKEGQE